MRMKLVLTGGALALAWVWGAEPAPPPAPPAAPAAARVKEWTAKLGDADFEAREKATLALAASGRDALPLVEAIEKGSEDLEVRARCAKLREMIAQPEQTAVGVLKHIEGSGLTFLRPGGLRARYDAAGFAKHLQGKAWLAQVSLTCSAREFIEKVATKSSLHGAAYRVRLADGTEKDLADWLEEKFPAKAP